MRRTPCISSSQKPGLSGYTRRVLTLGFVGAIGLLTPLLGPSHSAVAADQAAVPLSQALDQLESAVTSLEGAIPTQAVPAASPDATASKAEARTPQRTIEQARTLYDRRLFAAASSLLQEQGSACGSI